MTFASFRSAAQRAIENTITLGVAGSTRRGHERSQLAVPKRTRHLARSGWWGVWIGGRQVAGMAQDNNGDPIPPLGVGGTALILGRIGYNAYYAYFVHNGSARMAARPFLTDAWGEMNGDIARMSSGGIVGGWRR